MEGDYPSSPIARLDHGTLVNCLAHCSRSDYGSIASSNRAFRSLIKSNELYRLRWAKGTVEHWIYISCQLVQWIAYDPNRDRWLSVPRMTFEETPIVSERETLAVGTELLVFGIGKRSHVICRYSILTNAWTSGIQMNIPRCLFGSASLGEIAILAGGCDHHSNILDSAELYNSEMGEWTVLPSMNKARRSCSSVFMDGKFYVIGGIGEGNSEKLRCAEVYDLKTRTWTVIPNMLPNAAAEGPTDTRPQMAVVNNELYTAACELMKVWKYDKEKNVWITVGNLPQKASTASRWAMAFRACGNQLVLIGRRRALAGGLLEVYGCVPREGEVLNWRVLTSKPYAGFPDKCAVMGC